MLHAAVYDLCCAAPHQPADARYWGAEWVAYRKGYETALLMALKVMQLADDRFRLRVQTRRQETIKKRSA